STFFTHSCSGALSESRRPGAIRTPGKAAASLPGGYVFFQTPLNSSLRGAQLLSAFACNVSVFADALQVYRPLVGHTGTDPIVRSLPAAPTVAVKSGCPAHFLVPGV